MKISIAVFGVTCCIISIATGLEVHTNGPGSNVSYSPVTPGRVNASHVTASPNVTGVKAGYCPARTDWLGMLGACAPLCQKDSNCPGNQKCCHHGCGLRCVEPVSEEPYQINAPERLVASTTSSDAIHLTWYDSSLGEDQLIRDNRYYTIRYYSTGLGKYEYMNVTDLQGHVNGLHADTAYEFNVRVNDPPYLSEWSDNARNRTLPFGTNHTKHGTNHTGCKEAHTDDHHGDGSHGDAHKSKRIHVVEFNFDHVKTPLIFGLVVIIAGLSKIGFHHANFLSSKVPESCILIILGVIFGTIILLTGADKNFDFFAPDQFFLYLLPPIILEAAFSLHDRTFTDNLGSIIMFSVVGTVIACFSIGLTLVGLAQVGAMEDPQATTSQIFVFSALIVAVDPVAVLAIFQEVGVNNMLYFLVFGESLLNDGVTVVLYNVMQIYSRMDTIEADQIVLGIVKFVVVVFGGIFVGVLIGLLSSFITKFTNSVKVVEPIIIFGFAYQSYIVAEMFHFSGIISIIACGLIQMQYAFNNITNKSRLACKFFAKVISNSCEIIIFLFLGLKTVHPHHVWNTGFVFWTTFLCVLYRFIITFVMSFLINRCDKYRVRKIKFDEMVMISYGGLRGAVCFSLVALLDGKEFPMKDMFLTTTLFVIFFTVFVQGGTIKWLVKKMRVSLQQSSKDMILYQELNQHVSDHLMAGVEEIVGVTGKNVVREKFDRLDDKFIRPVLLRDPTKCDLNEINQYYEKLMMKEHYKNLRLCGVSNLPRVGSDLRQIDSSACLKVMDDEYEQRALERDEKIQDRRHRLVSQRSLKEAEGPEGVDLQKLFRSALVSSRNQAGHHFHDKNFVSDENRNLVNNLRNKYKRNQRLSTFHPRVERTMSWDEEKTDVAMRRTSDVKLNLRAGRAHTVDLSPLGSVSSDKVSSPPVFGLDDTVFEVEDEEPEVLPLLLNNNKTKVDALQRSEHEQKHVTFQKQNEIDSSKDKGTTHNTKDKDLEANIPVQNSKTGPSRAHSQHTGHLLRQDAMKDPDANVEIQMQDLGKSKDKINRQLSL